MNKAVIATTTLYESVEAPRFLSALKMVESAVTLGYEVVVVDGSPEEVRKMLTTAGANVFAVKTSGMGLGRRQAIRLAVDRAGSEGVVIWMEPEKYPLVFLLDQIVQPIIEKKADLIVIGRKSLASYPTAQQMSENAGNLIYQLMTGRPYDFYMGPRAFCSKVAKFFLDYQGEYGDHWDSIFIPVVRAIQQGLKVAEVRVDYVHPPEQTRQEEQYPSFASKRLVQLDNLTRAIVSDQKQSF